MYTSVPHQLLQTSNWQIAPSAMLVVCSSVLLWPTSDTALNNYSKREIFPAPSVSYFPWPLLIYYVTRQGRSYPLYRNSMTILTKAKFVQLTTYFVLISFGFRHTGCVWALRLLSGGKLYGILYDIHNLGLHKPNANPYAYGRLVTLALLGVYGTFVHS